MIWLIEKYTNKEAKYQYEDLHKADTKSTWADITKAKELLDWQPQIGLEQGIKRTVQWTKDY